MNDMNEKLKRLMDLQQQSRIGEKDSLESEILAPRTEVPYYPARSGSWPDSGAFYGGDDPEGAERLAKEQRYEALRMLINKYK